MVTAPLGPGPQGQGSLLRRGPVATLQARARTWVSCPYRVAVTDGRRGGDWAAGFEAIYTVNVVFMLAAHDVSCRSLVDIS